MSGAVSAISYRIILSSSRSHMLMPHVWGIYADMVGLEAIGFALVLLVAIAFYWIAGAARPR
jgi:hypothetical protein